MRSVRLVYIGVAWLFLGCVVIQVFLAGLGVFAGGANFETHRGFGYLFGWLTLVLVVLALAGRLGRAWIGWSTVLLVLFALQSVFVAVRSSLPEVAALHPVNAIAIFWVAQHVARGSLELVASRQRTAASAQPEGARA